MQITQQHPVLDISQIIHPIYFTLFPQGATVTTRAHGIDESKYDLFFRPEQATGQLDFVIQRISYRTIRDEAFETLLPGVMRVPIRGGYHYLNSDVGWREQADRYLSFVQAYDYHFHVCDLEGAFNVMSKAFAYEAWNWIHYVQDRTGKPTLLYTSPGLYQGHVRPSEAQYGINWNDIDLWVAQWLFTPNPNANPSPISGRTRPWKMWQYTDKGDGTLYGVSRPTACDLDVFNGTVQDMKLWLGLTEESEPGGDPMTDYFRLNTQAANIRSGPGASFAGKGYLAFNDVILADGDAQGNWTPFKIAQHSNGNWVTLNNGTPLDTNNTERLWTTNSYFVEVNNLPVPIQVPDPEPDPEEPQPAAELPATMEHTAVMKDAAGTVLATYKGTLTKQ